MDETKQVSCCAFSSGEGTASPRETEFILEVIVLYGVVFPFKAEKEEREARIFRHGELPSRWPRVLLLVACCSLQNTMFIDGDASSEPRSGPIAAHALLLRRPTCNAHCCLYMLAQQQCCSEMCCSSRLPLFLSCTMVCFTGKKTRKYTAVFSKMIYTLHTSDRS